MIFDVAKHFHLCPAIVKPVDCVPQGIVDGDGEDKGFYIAVSYVIEKFNQAVIPFRQRAHPLKGLGSIIITAFELLPVVFHAAKLSGQEFVFVMGWGGRCIPEPPFLVWLPAVPAFAAGSFGLGRKIRRLCLPFW